MSKQNFQKVIVILYVCYSFYTLCAFFPFILFIHHKGVQLPIPCCDIFGEGSGPVHLHDVSCTGSETNLTECEHLNSTVIMSNDHQQDVGVKCQQG